MAVALAVCDALEQALPERRDALKIKWPNDIYLNNGKAGGILIQNALSGAMLQSSVVGIGLNVNQTAFDPALPNPTSLLNFSGKKYDLDLLAENLFCLPRTPIFTPEKRRCGRYLLGIYSPIVQAGP